MAAKKAFIANRVGDAGLSLGIMLMFSTFGTVTFAGVSHAHQAGPGVLTALGLLLLLGACGKSAQLPLQSWLLDAMEGPTPVSALIHAATMVTAGVYLIVRSGPIFDLTADARLAVAIVGAATLLFGGIIGSAKDDIKKALAGLTMSQIGYMMLAAGVGPKGYPFAIALLLAHGFYKAGLFLDAGSIMHGMNDEVNMRRFGGLYAVPADHVHHVRGVLPGHRRLAIRLCHLLDFSSTYCYLTRNDPGAQVHQVGGRGHLQRGLDLGSRHVDPAPQGSGRRILGLGDGGAGGGGPAGADRHHPADPGLPAVDAVALRLRARAAVRAGLCALDRPPEGTKVKDGANPFPAWIWFAGGSFICFGLTLRARS